MASHGDSIEVTVNHPINQELLEDAVKLESGSSDSEVVEFTIKPGSKKGDNYASTINAVDVQAKVEGQVKTYHFIVKQIPPDPTWQKFIAEGNLFTKEIQVYSMLIPAMMNLQGQLGVNDPMTIDAPAFYSSMKQPNILVFENLAHLGYKMGDRYIGLDFDHSSLVMEALGKFHSLSYALKVQTGKSLDTQFPFLDEVTFGPKMEAVFGPAMNNSYESAIKVMRAVDNELAEKMSTFSGRAYQVSRDIRYNTGGLDFVAHGDCWVNNMLFKYDNQVPVSIKLLDFQVVRVCSPTIDLCHFIYTSTTSDVRRNRLKDLLKLYHDSFTATLQTMGLEFREFTYQRLCEKFKEDRLIGYFYAFMFLPVILARPEDIVRTDDMKKGDVGQDFSKRIDSNVDKLKNNLNFTDRLKEIVQDMQHDGYI